MVSNNSYYKENLEKKEIDWLKYLNTFILTFILGFTVMCFSSINSVKQKQDTQNLEIVRLSTVQAAHSLNISNLDARVSTIEMNQTESIKNWVMTNFVMKQQK